MWITVLCPLAFVYVCVTAIKTRNIRTMKSENSPDARCQNINYAIFLVFPNIQVNTSPILYIVNWNSWVLIYPFNIIKGSQHDPHIPPMIIWNIEIAKVINFPSNWEKVNLSYPYWGQHLPIRSNNNCWLHCFIWGFNNTPKIRWIYSLQNRYIKIIISMKLCDIFIDVAKNMHNFFHPSNFLCRCESKFPTNCFLLVRCWY